MNKMTGRELANELEGFVNGHDADDFEEFAEQVVHRTHRTLQQQIFQLMLVTMEKWAETKKSGSFDLRNEFTVNTSEKIIKSLRDDIYGSIPIRVPFI